MFWGNTYGSPFKNNFLFWRTVDSVPCPGGDGATATGITDLDIGGSLFDVSFVFSNDTGFLVANTLASISNNSASAVNAIITEFNLAGVPGVGPSQTISLSNFFVVRQVTGTVLSGEIFPREGLLAKTWIDNGDDSMLFGKRMLSRGVYATFQLGMVPLPAGVWLLGGKGVRPTQAIEIYK